MVKLSITIKNEKPERKAFFILNDNSLGFDKKIKRIEKLVGFVKKNGDDAKVLFDDNKDMLSMNVTFDDKTYRKFISLLTDITAHIVKEGVKVNVSADRSE